MQDERFVESVALWIQDELRQHPEEFAGVDPEQVAQNLDCLCKVMALGREIFPLSLAARRLGCSVVYNR